MIHILHGDDLEAIDRRLQILLSQFKDREKVKLSNIDDINLFWEAVFTRDIFGKEKILICVGVLSQKKVLVKDLAKIPKDQSVIFLEFRILPKLILTKVSPSAKIELFKAKPQIFWFLDSMSPNLKATLTSYANLPASQRENLLWQITNRFMQLALLKSNIPKKIVSDFIGKSMAPWQWEKLEEQAKYFSQKSLMGLFRGSLRIDFLVKSGKTSLEVDDLLNLLFIKYLKN